MIRRLRRAAQEPCPDLLLSSTKQITRESFVHAFGIPEERCWELGYPRNDHLVNAPFEPHPMLLADRTELDRVGRAEFVVGMFLTWRDDQATDIVSPEFVNHIAALCAQHGGLLVYKAHYNVAPADVDPALCVHLGPDVDLNSYLGFCNVLITDYSSVALDFLLLARPILYFMPDLERYIAQRGFYVDPSRLPGTMARDQASLVQALRRLLTAPRPLPADDGSQDLRRRVWGDYDGRAASAVAGALRRDINRRIAGQQTGNRPSTMGDAQQHDRLAPNTGAGHLTSERAEYGRS